MFRAFAVAVRGVAVAWRQELHLKLHTAAAVLVFAAAWWLGTTSTEWAILLLCIGLVFGLEYVNSALERLADRVTTAEDPLIRDAKDMAAGAVLVVSFASALVGILVLGPKLAALFS